MVKLRTVNFRDDVLFPIAHLLGIDPTTVDFTNEHARAWVSAINSVLRYGWEFYDWPELNLTEERAFRRIWYADEQYLRSNADTTPDEVYYVPNQTYYKVNAAAVTDPPPGTLPTDATYFTAIASADLDRYVAYDQPGKQAIGLVRSIYRSTPRLTPPALGWSQRPSELGIDVPWIAGPTVWLKYQVRPSVFSASPWSINGVYKKGDVVYDPTTGNCYRALVPSFGITVTFSAYWQLQPFPYILSGYVQTAVAAQFAEEQQQAAKLEQQAEDLLHREVDKCLEQGQRIVYGLNGQRCNRVPLGLSGFWWSVSAPDQLVA